MVTIGAKRQRHDLRHGGKIEIGIKVGKQRAATRWFPFEMCAEASGIDFDQQKIVLPGKVLRQGFTELAGGGKMDVAVLKIDGRAAEQTGALGIAPERLRTHFVDKHYKQPQLADVASHYFRHGPNNERQSPPATLNVPDSSTYLHANE
jgi:hypothetical protein